jgi:hypothetical protein
MTTRKREMLEGIQGALRESGFIIAKVLKSQPHFRSRLTLRNIYVTMSSSLPQMSAPNLA